MTVLTNMVNTEKRCMLKRDGSTITEAEKDRVGNSNMIRCVSGIDQMIYLIAYIKKGLTFDTKCSKNVKNLCLFDIIK